MTGRRARHAAEYALFRSVTAALRALPEGLALRVGAGLGWLAGAVLRIRRRDVDAHLAIAFPDRPPAWRRRVARASYAHLGREAVALFLLPGQDAERVVERTEVEGLEELRAALAGGSGVVMVTGHLGNWELGGAALAARGLPLDVVTKAMANRRFDADLTATRERLGLRVFDMAEAPRAMLRTLRAGRIATLVADQNAREGGLFVPFFGKLALTARGPALFAVRAGAPLFVGHAVRLPGLPTRYRIELERVDVEATGDLEVDVARLTAAHTAALERAVRRAPEQYFWQHKRWKTRPPEEPRSGAPV